jgi:non-specific serine/threonine protein kinase
MDRVRLAGHTAQALRPAGYDAEAVYLIAALQNLGRLLVQYHFAHDAAQIAALMQPAPAGKRRCPRAAGMSEESARYAVLGVDAEFGAAVARQWGLSDEGFMIRRLPVSCPVRSPDGDGDLLRMAASAANEPTRSTSCSQPKSAWR